MKEFHAKIRAALGDQNLQSALDANAERRIKARKTALESNPEGMQAIRRRAHHVRAAIIANLDEYLDSFINHAKANGVIVHLAADSREACQIALQIANNFNHKKNNCFKGKDSYQQGTNESSLTIVKSKSMVSEEIQLNKAFRTAGLEAIETDLGEYIVQLRDEHPSHIITPAVHLRREQVGRTFHQKLGIPFTDDISSLTNAARQTLRQYFLDADIGISGVNFGVAETGTLCIITNEGNGRMVTTLPAVHIALMGIERLVSSPQELALMLSLLPASATGQKITVYTQLIHSPRGTHDPDGPQERHLILVDNGRREIKQSPLSDSLMCIRCGACLNACPIFREIGGHAYIGKSGQYTPYPGPIGSVVSPGLFDQNHFGHLAQASTLCGACKEACPVDIDLPTLLLRVRAGGKYYKSLGIQNDQKYDPPGLQKIVTWALRFYTWLASDHRRFYNAQIVIGWLSRLFSPRSKWMRLPAFTGWGYSKDFPRPSVRPFRKRFTSRPSERLNTENKDPEILSTPNPPNQKSTESNESLTRRFASELSGLNGYFHSCTLDTLTGKIHSLLEAREINLIHAWHDEHLPLGVLDSLRSRGVRIQHQADPDIRAGLTGSIAAIAETGTLVIPSGEGRPQT
ncbi:MAG: LUD domain-containing protein, partial [Anaerolineales bacterium]